MHIPPPLAHSNFAIRRGAALALLLALAGCGYKGPLYMPPPPPAPAETLTLPPTPGNTPAPAATGQETGKLSQPAISIDNIRAK